MALMSVEYDYGACYESVSEKVAAKLKGVMSVSADKVGIDVELRAPIIILMHLFWILSILVRWVLLADP